MNLQRIASLVVLFAPAFVFAENWPQWRGPLNNGISAEKNIPSEWSDTKNVLWKTPMPGRAGSTPCIWGDKIFLTSTIDGSTDLVAMCLNTSGKELWRKVIGQGKVEARGNEGDAASPSPTTDGKHVWFLFGTGEFVCFDFEGKEVWKFALQTRYGKLDWDFGMHSTPVLHDGKLYLQLLRKSAQQVVCVEAATGNEVWKIVRESDGVHECLHSYASPFIWSNGKAAYLLSHGNDYTIAHDLKDGKELWRLGGLNPTGRDYNRTLRFVASPVCTPDMIVVPSAKHKSVVAVNPAAKGKFDHSDKQALWQLPKETPDVPSPLVVDGLVYLVGETGSLACVDAKSGKILYSKTPGKGYHRACPVYVDGKILVTARDGTIVVVKAGPAYEVLATNIMKDTQTASPALSGERLYLRCFKDLYAIGMK